MRSPKYEGQSSSSVDVKLKKEVPVAPVIPPLTPTFTPGIDKPAVGHMHHIKYRKTFTRDISVQVFLLLNVNILHVTESGYIIVNCTIA